MKKLKYILPPLISLIMVIFYFSPWITFEFGNWTYSSSHSALGLYSLAIMMLLIAWIPLIICTITAIVMKMKNNPSWKVFMVSSASIVFFYIAVIVGLLNDYMVTV